MVTSKNLKDNAKGLRIAAVGIAVLVCLYLVLVFVFGRPLSIFGTFEDGAKELRTGSSFGQRYDTWEQYELIDLVGLPADEVRNILREPGVDNTLAPTRDGGLEFVSASTGRDSSRDLAREVVVGYCVSMELSDRVFLSIGTSGDISPTKLDAIRSDRRGALEAYMKTKMCGPSFNGGVHINTILIRPR